MEETMIKNLEEKTGKPMVYWLEVAQLSGCKKHGELVQHLKESYGLTHGYANLVAHKAKGSDAGSLNQDDLVSQQYKGKEQLKPLYEALLQHIMKFGNDVEIAPKKAYVSLRKGKQFGLIQPSTKTRLDVGLVLKGVEPNTVLTPAGSWNTMVTHRIKVGVEDAVTEEIIAYVRKAYDICD